MKKIFMFTAIFVPISFLLLQSNSFSTASITNEAKLSIVSEDNALIAITYVQGKQFTITNNTGKTIVLDSVELNDESNNKIIELGSKGTSLEAGAVKEFNITADPKKLPGKVIEVFAHWHGGSTEIKSTIPENFFNKQELLETEKETEKEVPETIVESEKPEVGELEQLESVTPETPIVSDEPNTPEIVETEEPVMEVDEEIEAEEPIPVENPDKTIPEQVVD